MHERKPQKTCFQGGKRPREGDQDQQHQKEAKLGDLCLAVGNVTDALLYYKKALSHTPMEDTEERLAMVISVSKCFRQQGVSVEALSFVDGVMSSFSGRQRRDLLAERATLLCLLGRYGEAAKVCEEVQTAECGDEREKDAGVYLVLGHVLARLCRWKQAIVCLEQAATFSRMCGDLSTLGNALNNLGIVYKNLCRFHESARFLKKAVQAARSGRDDASLSVRLLNLATTLYKKGDLDKASKSVGECLKIASMLSLKRTRVLAQVCKARIERARGNLQEAHEIISVAIAEAESLNESRVCLVAKETLGDLLIDDGNAQDAVELLTACVAQLSPHAKDVRAEIESRLGSAYLALGKKAKAKEHAIEALGIAEEVGDLYEAGKALTILGASSGAAQGSLRYLERAETVFKRIGARLELGLTLYLKSLRRRCAGNDISEDLQDAATIFEACGAHRWLVRTLCDLALVYEQMSLHTRSLSCLDRAQALSPTEPAVTEIVKRTRSRIDASFSKALLFEPSGPPSSVDAVFSFLRSKLGVEASLLARLDRRGIPEIVKTWVIGDDVAYDLARAINAKGTLPFITTDLRDLVGLSKSLSDLRSVLAVGLGRDRSEGLFTVCWGKDARRPGNNGLEVSLFVRAYYEICGFLPLLEASIGFPAAHSLPVCIAGMVTADPNLRRTLLSLPRVAATPSSVLIAGETGTGKELVARAIHALSGRGDRPFVVQNCAALPEQLLESELFGHKAGAFTGARFEKRGLMETANGGTFFLDEVGDVSPAIQAKMLRAIEAGEIRRVGDTVTRPIDVRFLSATNKKLEEEVEAGCFRRDLYYRLNVVSVFLPPLRDRGEDTMMLAWLFMRRCALKMRKPVRGIDDDAMRALLSYDWPGNVRQLENEMEKAVTVVSPGESITADILSSCITGLAGEGSALTLRDEIRMVERRRITAALRKCRWNKTHAAKLLGDISRPALLAKMKRLGIPMKPD